MFLSSRLIRWPRAARIKSETQPKQRTPDRDYRHVVAESFLVAGSETASLLEQTERTLDLGARLVQFLSLVDDPRAASYREPA
jgi:hypothetical protein